MVNPKEEAVELIDEFLKTTTRDLIPSGEVQNLLIDVRMLLKRENELVGSRVG